MNSPPVISGGSGGLLPCSVEELEKCTYDVPQEEGLLSFLRWVPIGLYHQLQHWQLNQNGGSNLKNYYFIKGALPNSLVANQDPLVAAEPPLAVQPSSSKALKEDDDKRSMGSDISSIGDSSFDGLVKTMSWEEEGDDAIWDPSTTALASSTIQQSTAVDLEDTEIKKGSHVGPPMMLVPSTLYRILQRPTGAPHPFARPDGTMPRVTWRRSDRLRDRDGRPYHGPRWEMHDALRRIDRESQVMALTLTSYPFRIVHATESFRKVTGWNVRSSLSSSFSSSSILGRPLHDCVKCSAQNDGPVHLPIGSTVANGSWNVSPLGMTMGLLTDGLETCHQVQGIPVYTKSNDNDHNGDKCTSDVGLVYYAIIIIDMMAQTQHQPPPPTTLLTSSPPQDVAMSAIG